MNIAGIKNYQHYFTGGALALVVALAGCAPQRPYRPPPSSSTPMPWRIPPPAPEPAPPVSTETIRKPLPQDPRIGEQDLKSKLPPPPVPPAVNESVIPPSLSEYRTVPEPGLPPPPPLPDDSSLLSKITPGVTPQRAASLRLTDEGSKLLEAGETAKALSRLERSIVIDSTNSYGYFYLAKAQYRLGHYRESLNFLDVTESRLSGEPFWLAEVHALRGENYRALGQLQRAEASYGQAMRLNSGNRTAADALLRLQADAPPARR
ncbi:MAG: tetratricopeptide repeat protein [Candidatus Binatia bacterium]